MLDRKEILAQVAQGLYPNNWRVYHGRSTYGWTVMWGIASAIIIIILGTIALWSPQSGWSALPSFGILLIGSIILALVSWRRAKSKRRSILVIMPEGVIQCYGGNLKYLSFLYFSNIYRIELMQRTELSSVNGKIFTDAYYWLDVYSTNGVYIKWWINICFGDTEYLCKSIIAAYNHYKYQSYF